MKIKRCTVIFFLLLSLIFTCSCAVKAVKKTGISISYNYEQLLLLVMSQKERVSRVYGKDLFNLKFNINKNMAREGSYKELFLEDMRNFIMELEVLNRLAADENIQVSEDENKSLAKIANSYYEELRSNTDFKNISQEDVLKVFVDYYRANKFKDSLISTGELEVSESEARVLKASLLIFNDEEKAKEAQKALENEEFGEVSKKYASETRTGIKLTHKDLPPEVDKRVFSLENEENSEIIKLDNKYYIYKILNSYDEEATKENKDSLKKERSRAELAKRYNEFIKEQNISISIDTWDRVLNCFDKNLDIKDFFTIYEEKVKNAGL